MALTESQRKVAVVALRLASDESVSAPLWDFRPELALHVLSERKRRNLLQHDPEPIGDPEYT